MNISPLLVIVIIALFAIAGYAYFGNTMTEPTNDAIPADMVGTLEGNDEAVIPATIVTLTDTGFSPASVTVKKGEAVKFVNESSGDMWIGADEHPTHTEYDGTSRSEHCTEGKSASFDQCGRSDEYTFTFLKAGTWGYHNHAHAESVGTVIVTE